MMYLSSLNKQIKYINDLNNIIVLKYIVVTYGHLDIYVCVCGQFIYYKQSELTENIP